MRDRGEQTARVLLEDAVLRKLARLGMCTHALDRYDVNHSKDVYAAVRVELSELMSHGAIQNPAIVFSIARDLAARDWIPEVPVLVAPGLGDFLRFYGAYGRLKEHGGETVNDFLFTKIPTVRVLEIAVGGSEDKPAVSFEQGGTGDIWKVWLTIPSAKEEIPAKLFGERRRATLERPELKEFSADFFGTPSTPMTEAAQQFYNDPGRFAVAGGVAAQLRRTFGLFGRLTGNLKWNELAGAGRIDALCSVLTAVSLLPYFGVNKVGFYLSRDYRLPDGMEESSGGYIVYHWARGDDAEIPAGGTTAVMIEPLLVYISLRNKSKTTRQYLESANRHALRSAVAAIMARNMSHNLGSHGLARIIASAEGEIGDRNEWVGDKDDVGFLRHMRARMDFIAEITTLWREMPWLERLTS